MPSAPSDPPNLSTLWGRVLVDELARSGLRHAVVAPGSRSTPLALALADHPDVEDLSVIDERSAAFVALGLARATGRPVAVVSTSGTAATNFLPAVTEADRAAVPLLVLTADRPAELQDAGDSQAADQAKLYGDRVRWFHQAAEPSAAEGRLAYLRSTACHAWARAMGTGGPPGPVHLDLPLRKPLEPTPVEAGPGALPPGFDPARSPGATGRAHGAPWRRVSAGPQAPAAADVEEIAEALAGAARPLILVGALVGDPAGGSEAIGRALSDLAGALSVPVWAEAASGLRTGPGSSGPCPGLVATADLLLASERFRELARPDLVLRLGEAPLAWPLRRWAAELAAAGVRQLAIDPWGRRRDPEHAVARMVAADPAATLAAVADRLESSPGPPAGGGWLALHLAADRAARAALDHELEGRTAAGEVFEGGVFWHLGRLLPEDTALVVSSSMPLRDLEAFLAASRQPVDLFSNRGLNGIDGVTSTAAGIALARRVPRTEGAAEAAGGADGRTVLVAGDVAFAHDLSGALAAGRLGADLTVVLLDNGGGAIFDYLPAAGFEPGFSRHLTTPPGAGFADLAAGCGLAYAAPRTWEGFGDALERALADPGPHLLHLRFDRERGREIRREVLEQVGAAVDGAPLELPGGFAPARAAACRAVRWTSGPRGSSTGVESGAPTARPAAPGPPLVLLHGFTGSAADWADLAARLRGAGGPEVVALDLPGHGGAAGSPGCDSWEEGVAAIAQALARLGPEPVHLAGYSLGARLALAFALAAPERVASLALVGGAPGLADPDERARRRAADEALAREIEATGLATFVDRWMAQPLFATQYAGPGRLGHRRLRLARTGRLDGSARGYAGALRALGQGNQPSYRERLGEVAVPTLIVAGELDPRYVAIAREMAGAIPGARLEVVPGAGHAVHLEAPDAVARLLLDHLADRGRPSSDAR